LITVLRLKAPRFGPRPQLFDALLSTYPTALAQDLARLRAGAGGPAEGGGDDAAGGGGRLSEGAAACVAHAASQKRIVRANARWLRAEHRRARRAGA
jgi:hypothetical protein